MCVCVCVCVCVCNTCCSDQDLCTYYNIHTTHSNPTTGTYIAEKYVIIGLHRAANRLEALHLMVYNGKWNKNSNAPTESLACSFYLTCPRYHCTYVIESIICTSHARGQYIYSTCTNVHT